MYAIRLLRENGFTVHAFEAGDDVGGTWYWNRYPGARCDVESFDYCYTFSPELHAEWTWSERYPSQPELLRYAGHVADRFDLRRDITFGARITSAVYQEENGTWLVTTEQGEQARSRFCVTAVGCLSASRTPDLPGIEHFEGDTHHTGRWPHEGVDLTGKRVAVIGTGSSGIQVIPEIAKQARRLTVFQRTPNFSLPARNRRLSGREIWQAQSELPNLRTQSKVSPAGHYVVTNGRMAADEDPAELTDEFERRWDIGGTEIMSCYTDTGRDLEANRRLADFVRAKIRAIVQDPETAAKLTPTDHPIGSKRICVDSGYYGTYNQEHVELIDLRAEPIEEITATGILTAEGQKTFDVIVFATGYDAMTGPLTRIDLRGRDGMSIAEAWKDGPHTYLGLGIAGFPNLLTITGPGSPSVLANVIRAIEQHVEWIVGCLAYLRERRLTHIEALPDSQGEWGREVAEASQQTLFPLGKSWYLGDNIEGKPRVFMPYVGGLDRYREKCDRVAADGYEGFALTGEAGE
ncbi:flavin-containing monooxygenase [Streptomyces sp. NPDC002920]